MKFKVGDKVRILSKSRYGRQEHEWPSKTTGYIISSGQVFNVDWVVNKNRKSTSGDFFMDNELELVNKGDNMGRRTFRLLKETDVFKKGAIFQEMCDDGDQDYEMIEGERKFEKPQSCTGQIVKSREDVEKNPTWYEEVFNPATMWVTKAELSAMSSAFQPKKRGRPSKK